VTYTFVDLTENSKKQDYGRVIKTTFMLLFNSNWWFL